MAKKILAIDDDDSFLLLLRDALEGEGYQFLSARDGREGLRQARAAKPDVILLDLMIPGVHGFEICADLRGDQGLAGAKIIIVSAKGFAVDRTAAEAIGADHYLVKPFRVSELLALI